MIFGWIPYRNKGARIRKSYVGAKNGGRFASFWKEESCLRIRLRVFCFFSEKKGLPNLNGSGSGEGRWVGLRCLP